jgi:hypothetical protein
MLDKALKAGAVAAVQRRLRGGLVFDVVAGPNGVDDAAKASGSTLRGGSRCRKIVSAGADCIACAAASNGVAFLCHLISGSFMDVAGHAYGLSG